MAGVAERGRPWVLLAGLALVLGSDYKVRVRDSGAAISGSADVFIVLELACYAAVGLFVLLTWRDPRAVLRSGPEPLLAGLYLLVVALSVLRTPYPLFGAARAAEALVLGGLALAIATGASRADLHRLAHGFLVLAAVSVLYGVLRPSPPVTPLQEGRFGWLAVHPTVAGAVLAVAAVIGLAYLTLGEPRPGPRWPWWVYAALLAVVVWGLLATRTRAAVLAVVVGALAAQWAYRSGRRRVDLLATAALGAALAALTVLPVVQEYFARGESVERLQSLNSRTELWSAAWTAVQAQPVYGYGLGAAQGIFQERFGLGGGHNSAINVAVDLGLVGLVAWGALVVAMAVGLARLPRTGPDGTAVDRALLLGVFVAVHVNGIFYSGPGAVANVAATWLFVVLGWLVRLRTAAGTAPAAAAGGRGATAADRAAGEQLAHRVLSRLGRARGS